MKKFSRKYLINWIENNPYKEAFLISKVPVKASTLGRIKSGHYKPSKRMMNAIIAVIEGKEKPLINWR